MAFGKKRIKDLPPLVSDAEISGASYGQVIDFLVSVNKADFDKIIKVAQLHRKTNADVAKVTGVPAGEPLSIFELQTIADQAVGDPDTDAGDFLDDAELNAAFSGDDDQETPASRTQRRIATETAKGKGK